jgi:hypothetical protein
MNTNGHEESGDRKEASLRYVTAVSKGGFLIELDRLFGLRKNLLTWYQYQV